MKTKNHVFSNKDITVTYNPKVCINAERCALELSNVFRQSVIPWIDLEADSNENIINQVKKCPSGALQFCMNKKEAC
tara:strand:- start:53 stop:283 length:231 start_codon:yes stop_codon:yes gene_type:complete